LYKNTLTAQSQIKKKYLGIVTDYITNLFLKQMKCM